MPTITNYIIRISSFLVITAFFLLNGCKGRGYGAKDDEIIKKLNAIADNSILKHQITVFRLDTLVKVDCDFLMVCQPYFDADKFENQYHIEMAKVKSTNIEYADKICVIVFFKKNKLVRCIEIPRTKIDFAKATSKDFFLKPNVMFQVTPSNTGSSQSHTEVTLIN